MAGPRRRSRSSRPKKIDRSVIDRPDWEVGGDELGCLLRLANFAFGGIFFLFFGVMVFLRDRPLIVGGLLLGCLATLGAVRQLKREKERRLEARVREAGPPLSATPDRDHSPGKT